MSKNFILILIAFILSESLNAQSEYIIYEFPESVTQKAREYIEGCVAKNDSTRFIAKLEKNDDGHYLLFIMIYDFEKIESFKLLNEEIIKKTDRMVRVSDRYLLPLITGEDFLFAYLGDVPMRNGKRGRKKILLNSESYCITFDALGNIY